MKPRFIVDLEDFILLINPHKSNNQGPYYPVGVLPDEMKDTIKRLIEEVNETELQVD